MLIENVCQSEIVAVNKVREVCRWVCDKSRSANVTNEVVEVDGFDATKEVSVNGGEMEFSLMKIV